MCDTIRIKKGMGGMLPEVVAFAVKFPKTTCLTIDDMYIYIYTCHSEDGSTVIQGGLDGKCSSNKYINSC